MCCGMRPVVSRWYVRITRESVPGVSGEVVIAGGADLIDTMLQAVEGGSFEGHMEPFQHGPDDAPV